MLLKDKVIVICIFISIPTISKTVDSTQEVNKFINDCKQTGINWFSSTKDGYVILFDELNSKDSIYNIFTDAVERKSRSIVLFKFNESINNHNVIPENYAFGSFLYSIYTLLYNRRYYTTFCLIDSSGNYLCLWSSRSSGYGQLYDGNAKKVSRRITNYIKRKHKGVKVLKIWFDK